jgi:glucose/arabinose dehydrogenase
MHPDRKAPAYRPVVLSCLGTLALAACSGGTPAPAPATTTGTTAPQTATTTATPGQAAAPSVDTGPSRDVATGLAVPWSVVVLPDRGYLVSERDTGKVLRFSAGGERRELGTVPGVDPAGEGGLLGLAVAPGNASVLYAYITADADNRVLAIPMTDTGLGAPTPILTGIAKAGVHNGGRIGFGPDGYLYVGTGDASERSRSQQLDSLSGKILRMTTQGAPAPGNPYADSLVWSSGHRNVQGFAWDAAGRMWASEFGQNAWDELNLIKPGANYGWPAVEGIAGRAEFVDPVRQWTPAQASPSGVAVGPDGTVYIAGLRGQSLWRVPVAGDGSTGEPQRLLEGRYGRLRDVLTGPDGRLWVVSNNTSRGTPRSGDDRIVSLAPADL